MASSRTVVFGGTGFLGRRIVARLLHEDAEVRVAARHLHRPDFEPISGGAGRVELFSADIRDEASTVSAVDQCAAAVNAVGLYVERGDAKFVTVHVDGAERLARNAARAGLSRLIHISGIGADPQSESDYVRARADGESRVRAAFPSATIIRPSVMFGPGDSFFNALDRIARFAPIIPMFGAGTTRLQPVYVDDVADAVARALQDPATQGKIIELGGPQSYFYRSLIEFVLRHKRRRRLLLPLPFLVWDALARLGSVLPRPPVTRAQIALMKRDNVVDSTCLTFKDLGIDPRSIEEIVPAYL
jgi:NADH dehydrogenase